MNKGVVLVADRDEETCAAIATHVKRLALAARVVSTGAQLLEAVSRQPPVLVVISVELIDPTGFEVCRELRERYGESLPIVFVGAERAEARDEIAGLLLGADDYFTKPLSVDGFVARVRRLVIRPLTHPAASPLTKREHEVLELLIAGCRSTEVADELCIARKTASTHIEHILGKLGAHSQAQAVAIALRDGLVDPRPARAAM